MTVSEGATGVVVSDGELIERAGAGDQSAFEALYRRYARSLFGLALRRLGDSGRAEDAVQDTFVSIWRSARTYRPERGLGGAWLYAVARNAIIDRSRASVELTVDEALDGPSLEAGPDVCAEQAWTEWRVHQAIEALPDHEREVIALAYWSGFSQREVAQAVGIPLGTVKTRTRSALRRLATMLDGELG
jgi:RNA polymerase sigma-70 factor (ECF subfamily)